MSLLEILEKQKQYEALKDTLPQMTLASYEQSFEVEYTHHSTAIEGNTLTLMETKVILEDGIAIGGKSLKEIYEVVNHKKAYQYVKECIQQGLLLDEKIVKDIHALLMENILTGGIYRREEVTISGASHTPPAGNEMYSQIKNFYAELAEKNHLNGVELAAWTHAEFVRIHPFADGNGRTSRLLMNYQLLSKGFLPVSVAKENRLDYYNALDKYAAQGELNDFMELVAGLEEKQLEKYLANVVTQEEIPPTQ
ncbi:MAG: Fic family protein [Clostridiales bacterium]|nr:Fic family protein [Clostridiales bacterium]